MEKLNRLKENLSKPEVIDIEQDDNTIPLVSRPLVIIPQQKSWNEQLAMLELKTTVK